MLLAMLLPAMTSLQAAEWTTIPVPGAWEEKGPPEARSYDGIAWYRTWVKVPAAFLAKTNPKNGEEFAGFQVRNLADAHEVFINGIKLGGAGNFPPEFRSAGAEFHRHPIPVGTLQGDGWNEFAVRVYNQSGPGGFLSEAPFLVNRQTECPLDGTWEFRLGDDYVPGGPRTERPASSAFDQFRTAIRLLERAAVLNTGPKLTPEESLARMTPAEDLRVDLMLSEPLVAQPIHVSFDERGRLWVTQYRQYPYPAGVKMVSRTSDYRSQYDRMPAAPPNHTRGADVISIHEDSDRDGVFDRHKVFQDGLNLANSAVRGHGGVWVLNPPYLLFYPDRDFDDVPDGPPEVHLRGFGLEDTHSVANGLVWGPDGWLYGGHGNTSASRVTRPGLDSADAPGAYTEGCMVWRFHPKTRTYEIFAMGSGNTFGLDFDADGRLYSGHNGGKTRGWHYVQGGYYPRQTVDPRNPYAFGTLVSMPSTTPVGRFSHFGSYVAGTALPARYQGQLFALDPLHHEIIATARTPVGANFETRDVGQVLGSTDPAFRPVYIANGPDGGMYVADLYDFYTAHSQHYLSQIDPSTGRIFRLRGKSEPLERDYDLSAKTTPGLVALLSHPNKWHRFTAVRLLGERRDPAAAPLLRRELTKSEGHAPLAALWSLHQADALDEKTVDQALAHPRALVRGWAVRFLGDRFGMNRGPGLPRLGAASLPELPKGLAARLVALARTESDPETRSQIAATARRLDTTVALDVFDAFTSVSADAPDAFLPLLAWWILEAHLWENQEAILRRFDSPQLWRHPTVGQHVLSRLMRRLVVEGRRPDYLAAAQLLQRAPTAADAARLMQGFGEGFRGRAVTGLPPELIAAMTATGQAPLALRVRQADPPAIDEALGLLRNQKADMETRVSVARAFGEIRHPAALPLLLQVAASEEPLLLRKAALVAIAAYDSADIGPWAANLATRSSADLRPAVLALIASRPVWMAPLLQAIETGRLARKDVPREIADRLRAAPDKPIAELAQRVFSSDDRSPQTPSARQTEIESILSRGSGNSYQGEPLFMQLCGSCHTLFQKGGRLGPDLTSYQRDTLGTLLPAIVNPNAEIREGFQYYTVATHDGRTLGGFLLERDGRVVVLRGLDGEDVTLSQTDVREIKPVGRSLMPEGLLDTLNEQQVRDLFAYLRLARAI